MYFALYSTFQSIFADKFKYPCIIIDLEKKKKTKPISHPKFKGDSEFLKTSVTSKAQKTVYMIEIVTSRYLPAIQYYSNSGLDYRYP